MNSEITSLSQPEQEIYLIVKAFYGGSDPSINMKVLETQMRQFSRSDQAWEICIKLLKKEGLPDDEVYSFAAQTLKEKMRFDFASQNANEEFLAKLWQDFKQLLDLSPRRPTNVNRFLCNGLSIFVMHLVESVNSLEYIIGQVVPQEFSLSNLHKYISAIRMLEEMPLIAYREDIVIDLERQRKFKKLLKNQAEWVLNFLNQLVWLLVVEAKDTRAKEDIMQTFSEWLNFGVGKTLLADMHEKQKNLLDLVFAEIKQDQNFQAAADCFQEIVHYCREETFVLKDLSKLIFDEIQKIKPRARLAIQNQDLGQLDVLSPIFLELAGSNLQTICQTKDNPQIQDLMALLCSIFAVQDIEIEFHCYLWSDFIMELTNQAKPDMIEYYSGCLLNVLNSLVEKAKFSGELMGSLNSKPYTDKMFNEMASTRKKARKLAFEIGQVLGPLKPLQTIGAKIYAAREIMESDQEKAILEMESCIYLFAHFLDNQEDIPKTAVNLIPLMSSLPLEIVQVRRSIIDLIGTLSPYLNTLASEEEVVTMLKIQIESFQSALVVEQAGECFKRFIRYNSHLIQSHLEELVQNFGNVLCSLSDDRYASGIISGYVLLAYKQKGTKVGEIVKEFYAVPIVNQITNLLDVRYFEIQDKERFSKRVQDKLEIQLINVSSIFQALLDYLPVEEEEFKSGIDKLFMEFWENCFKQLMKDYSESEGIIEALSRSVKFIFRLFGNSMMDVLTQFAQILVLNYRDHKYSCYIYGAEFLISIFGNKRLRNDQNSLILEGVFNEIVALTLPILDGHQVMEQNPLIAQDFFGMLTRSIRYSPDILLKSPQFVFIIECGKSAIGVEHFNIAKILYSFFEELFILAVPYSNSEGALAHHGEGNPFISEDFGSQLKYRRQRFGDATSFISPQQKQACYTQILENGSEIMERLIVCTTQAPPQTIVNYIIDCMISLARVNWIEFIKWIDLHIKKVPTYMLTPSQIDGFAMDLNLAENLEEVTDKLHHLALRCKKGQLRN